jgi:hypothetical protein
MNHKDITTKNFILYLAAIVAVGWISHELVGCAREDMRATNEHNRLYYIERSKCHDSSTLLATTFGSPNEVQCEHPDHKMRVEIATKNGEEIGSLVHCECPKVKEQSN